MLTDLSMGWRMLMAEGQPSLWLFVLLTRLQVTKAALNNNGIKFSSSNLISFKCKYKSGESSSLGFLIIWVAWLNVYIRN